MPKIQGKYDDMMEEAERDYSSSHGNILPDYSPIKAHLEELDDVSYVLQLAELRVALSETQSKLKETEKRRQVGFEVMTAEVFVELVLCS
jgi:hypothetical protein